jgi:hypothetical protein
MRAIVIIFCILSYAYGKAQGYNVFAKYIDAYYSNYPFGGQEEGGMYDNNVLGPDKNIKVETEYYNIFFLCQFDWDDEAVFLEYADSITEADILKKVEYYPHQRFKTLTWFSPEGRKITSDVYDSLQIYRYLEEPGKEKRLIEKHLIDKYGNPLLSYVYIYKSEYFYDNEGFLVKVEHRHKDTDSLIYTDNYMIEHTDENIIIKIGGPTRAIYKDNLLVEFRNHDNSLRRKLIYDDNRLIFEIEDGNSSLLIYDCNNILKKKLSSFHGFKYFSSKTLYRFDERGNKILEILFHKTGDINYKDCLEINVRKYKYEYFD